MNRSILKIKKKYETVPITSVVWLLEEQVPMIILELEEQNPGYEFVQFFVNSEKDTTRRTFAIMRLKESK